MFNVNVFLKNNFSGDIQLYYLFCGSLVCHSHLKIIINSFLFLLDLLLFFIPVPVLLERLSFCVSH